MSDGMGRELAYLSSHATNRYFIPNWGNVSSTISKIEDSNTEKTSTIKVTYTVQAKDAKGNWTKRTAKRNNGTSWVENRTITYYSAK